MKHFCTSSHCAVLGAWGRVSFTELSCHSYITAAPQGTLRGAGLTQPGFLGSWPYCVSGAVLGPDTHVPFWWACVLSDKSC